MDPLQQPEVWMRGPIPKVPALLQPAAHALLQAKEEIVYYLQDFPDELLWQCPAGVASVGFHLQHITGVLDRMYTYSQKEALSEEQFAYLKQEGDCSNQSVKQLVIAVSNQIDLLVERLTTINELVLTQERGVGRLQLPTTVIGLLFHAAEHTQRHVGQLLVTARILKYQAGI